MSREYDQIKGLIRNTEECLSTAYKRGYKDGKSSVDKPTYEQGLNDAWEYALKVGMYGCEYYKNNVFPKNPNYDVWDIIRHYSASEAIAKIKEYEDKKKKANDIEYVYFHGVNGTERVKVTKAWTTSTIKVGDLVRLIRSDSKLDNYAYGVCLKVSDANMFVMRADGSVSEENPKEWYRTGKNYSFITETLEQMKGETK